MGRKFLYGVEQNWDCIYPGCWSERAWIICSDGSFVRTVSYVQGDAPIPEKVIKGQFSRKDFDRLVELINMPWGNETVDACDGSAWEFKAYGPGGEVVKERPLGYVYDIEPYESMTLILMRYDEYD